MRIIFIIILAVMFISWPVHAQVESEYTVTLTWVDASDNEDGFVVYLKTGDVYEVIHKTAANVTKLEVAIRSPEGKQWCYAVAAFGKAGESAKSEDCVTVRATIPSAPEKLIAEIIAKLEALRELVK